MQNTILLLNNILLLKILFSSIFTVNTFASSKSALNFYSKYSFLQYTPNILTNYPVTTHISQFTLYNPVTQQKVVTYVDNYRYFTNYSLVR